jgi:hypothetical protein
MAEPKPFPEAVSKSASGIETTLANAARLIDKSRNIAGEPCRT